MLLRFITNNCMSILNNGMLKWTFVTDIIKHVGHTQNSCSSCDQQEDLAKDSGGGSISVPGKSGSHRLEQEGLGKLRADCPLDPWVSTYQRQEVGRGPRVRLLQRCEVEAICLHLLFYGPPLLSPYPPVPSSSVITRGKFQSNS